MQTDSPRDSRALTSGRALGIYALSFFLMLLLDAGRFSALLDRLDIPPLAIAGDCIEKVAEITGAGPLARTESTLLNQLTPQKFVGSVSASQEQETVYRALQELQAHPSPTDASAPPQPAPSQIRPLPEQALGTPTVQNPQDEKESETVSPPIPQHKPRVLLVGDSMMMEGFGPVLQRTLRKRPDIEVIREGRYSTGLSRRDYFDWPAHLKQLVERDDPDLVIICMGANDPQDIIDENKKRHHADSASWKEVYRSRAEQLLNIATSRGSRVIWAGLPIMSKEPYSTRIRRLSNLQKEACEKFPQQAIFVDTKAALADSSGKYMTFMTDEKGRHVRLRYKDMVHVTEDGGRLLTARLLPFIDRQLAQGRLHSTPSSSMADNVSQTISNNDSPLDKVMLSSTPRTERYSFHSHARGKEVTYYAFLPEKKKADEKFPVIYLLHGAFESGEVWKREAEKDLLALASRHRLIFIAPSFEPLGWYLDSPLVADSQIETFLIQEFLPYVEKTFPVSSRKSLMGISMGGHGALSIGLRHPDLFVSLSSMSGVLDITRHPQQWKLKELLGPFPQERQAWQSHAPFYLLKRDMPLTTPPMLITTGKQDRLVLQENRAFRDLLRRRHFRYLYREAPGEHDWDYWHTELTQHVVFHTETLMQPPAP